MRRLWPACAFVWLLWPVGRAHAGDPRLKWRTVTTRHFFIHYYEQERHVARRLAVICERVHAVLSRRLRWQPRRRVHVVVTDDTDGANGFSQVIPRNVIHLFVTAPAALSPLGDFDDWLTLLFVHEYTHALHLSIRDGFAELVNTIFGFGRGVLYAPNLLQPRWFIEGIAVLDETIRTTGGRIRSSYFRMILRAALLEGKAFSLSEASSSMYRYPHGRVPYLYGAFFLSFLYERFGWSALVGISHDYGRQPIPYGLNKIARRHLSGRTYLRLYEEWIRRKRLEAETTLERLERRGLRAGRPLTRTGESTFEPRFHPGKPVVAFVEDDGHSERSLRLLDLRTGRKRRITRVEGGATVAWSADGRKIYVAQPEAYRAVYSYNDLYVWDLERRTLRRLTRGLRARYVAVSPDGRLLAYTRNALGRSCLYVRRVAGPGSERRLWCGGRWDNAYSPRFSPDGRRIVFSAWLDGGFRDLLLLDLLSGQVRRLTRDRALDLSPVFDPTGEWVVFSSDRTGIFNVYALHLRDRRLVQLTNVATGAFQPAISPDGRTLVYVGFRAEGFDLYEMPFRLSAGLSAPPFLRVRPERSETTGPGLLDPGQEVILSDRPYRPIFTLPPETWWADLDTAAGSVTLSLSGNDVVGYHGWALAARLGWRGWSGSVTGAYNYSRLYTPLHFGFSYSDWEAGDLKQAGRVLPYRRYEVGLSGGFDIPLLVSYRYGRATLRLRYRYRFGGPRTQPEVPLDPSEPLVRGPDFPREGKLAVSVAYGKTRAYTYSFSAEQGRSLGLSLDLAAPELGASGQAATLKWRWTEYVPMPWLSHHVLVLRYTGGIGWGDPGSRTLFSLGGFGSQDYLQAIFQGTVVWGSALRGYPPGAVFGDHYDLVNLEYRFPIWWINRGLATLPIYFERIWGTVFADGGLAYFGQPGWDRFLQWRWDAGAELLLEIVFGYVMTMTLRISYAYGFGEAGGHQFHVFFGTPLG